MTYLKFLFKKIRTAKKRKNALIGSEKINPYRGTERVRVF